MDYQVGDIVEIRRQDGGIYFRKIIADIDDEEN